MKNWFRTSALVALWAIGASAQSNNVYRVTVSGVALVQEYTVEQHPYTAVTALSSRRLINLARNRTLDAGGHVTEILAYDTVLDGTTTAALVVWDTVLKTNVATIATVGTNGWIFSGSVAQFVEFWTVQPTGSVTNGITGGELTADGLGSTRQGLLVRAGGTLSGVLNVNVATASQTFVIPHATVVISGPPLTTK